MHIPSENISIHWHLWYLRYYRIVPKVLNRILTFTDSLGNQGIIFEDFYSFIHDSDRTQTVSHTWKINSVYLSEFNCNPLQVKSQHTHIYQCIDKIINSTVDRVKDIVSVSSSLWKTDLSQSAYCTKVVSCTGFIASCG